MTTLISNEEYGKPAIDLNDFQIRVLEKLENYDDPMVSIYQLCKRLDQPQQSSQQKFYVKVYRACEKLVALDLVWVMRGTRDPSVYLAKCTVKGYTQLGEWELPF